jgi:hypothetical protein
MNQRQPLAMAAKPVRDAPAEPGTVDCHDGIGPRFPDRLHGLAHPAQDQRSTWQHLGDAGHREIRERHEARDTPLGHALAADPGNPQPAAGSLAQRPDQRAAERIARRLPGHDEDERRALAAADHSAEVMVWGS